MGRSAIFERFAGLLGVPLPTRDRSCHGRAQDRQDQTVGTVVPVRAVRRKHQVHSDRGSTGDLVARHNE